MKTLERESRKSEKEEKAEKLKLKKAIQKGNMEGARIHAENSIRQKSQALNYLRMAARVDAVASRVQSAVTQRKVNVWPFDIILSVLTTYSIFYVQILLDMFIQIFSKFFHNVITKLIQF